LVTYVVKYYPTEDGTNTTSTISTNDTNTLLSGLTPFTNYTITVQVAMGPVAMVMVATNEGGMWVYLL
jgi:hypothetical protein